MTEVFIKEFKQISKKDIEIAGGKGASLGEMMRAEIPVPDGFVVLSSAFDWFIKETGLDSKIKNILDKVNVKEIYTVENASQKIQAMIISKEIPEDIKNNILKSYKKLNNEFVAVRSSATLEDSNSAAWAGQLDSFLNTKRNTLLENVKKCWASLFTSRAIFYRFEKGLNKEKISVAVVVQKMIDSEKSGTAFSVHPVTEDENEIIIEAGFGLGEAVVSGQVTPDSYTINKQEFEILNVNVNEQARALYKKVKGGSKWKKLNEKGKEQVLTEKEIIELSKLVIRIEKNYGFPCDIEWAKEGENFYITQSRPITTIRKESGMYRVLKVIEKEKFFKSLVYSFTPIICFESTLYCYINNPLIEKLGITSYPNFIVFWNKKYEEWESGSIKKINDHKKIRYIIEESKNIIEKHSYNINKLTNKNYINLSNEKIINSLDMINKINTEIYYRYIFYIDEYFETKDEELLKVLPETRVELSNFVDKIYDCCDRIIEALSERFHQIEWENFLYATFKELKILLEKPNEYNIENFKKINKKEVVFVFDGKQVYLFRKSESLKIIRKQLERSEKEIKNKKTDIIKGMPTFQGIVVGTVFKISEDNYQDIGKVLKNKKDYILVTPMTRPESVPFLKNAKAIITDEGGITCHAAIVSREMKIPCVVGTRVASKLLKNGMKVEVDANKGVVKIM
jgi:phosphoenolpyruvate synthase/pyruvate phosphate dikinase